jgi:hypothetical protein
VTGVDKAEARRLLRETDGSVQSAIEATRQAG